MTPNEEQDLLFLTNLVDQRQAIDKLIEESHATGDYYFYIVTSGFIACLGLLNNNPVAIIGAMLIAPALFPILSLGMGIVTASRLAVIRALKAIVISFLAVAVTSAMLTFLFHATLSGAGPNEAIELASSPNLASMFIATCSGFIASYAWVKQSQSALLPGVAVAVSLVPPLANIGIGITLGSGEVFAGSLLTFILNLLFICFASVVVFSVFGFSDLRNWQAKRIAQEKKEDEEAKERREKTAKKLEEAEDSE